jgi:hypothetical protein
MQTLMSADEVHANVYSEQGFLVMLSFEHCPVGSIHICDAWGELETTAALRCVGPSNFREFARQVERMNELSGVAVPAGPHQPGARYYRMEPCD